MYRLIDSKYKLNITKIFFASLICYLILFWFAGVLTVIAAPLILSLFIFIFSNDLIWETNVKNFYKKRGNKKKAKNNGNALSFLLLSIIIGFFASLLALLLLDKLAFTRYFQNMPTFINRDIPVTVYTRILYPLVEQNQINSIPWPLFILSSTLLTCLFSSILLLYRNYAKQFASWLLLGLLCFVFIVSSIKMSAEFRSSISQEPPDLSYAYDAVIYLKLFYLMKDKDYYSAHLEAHSKDIRLSGGNVIKNGKYYGFVASPLYFRTPYIFYFWRFLSPGNATGIFYIGLGISVLVIVLSYFCARTIFGDKGILLTAMIVPYIFMGLTWYNLFFPDWWASLAIISGIFFWIKQRYLASALLFLLAALFREVTIIFLIFFLAVTLIKKRQEVIKFLGANLIFLIVYSFHYVKAQKLIASDMSSADSIISRFFIPIPDLIQKFLTTSSYMVFPYGFFLFPAFILIILALLGWFQVKRITGLEMFSFILLSVPYFIFASSSYWGQHLLLFIIFSAPIIFIPYDKESN